MGIQSIGVGSGLDLNGLVTQLLEAESKPKYDRLDKQEESLEAVISGIGQLKSKMDDFKESVDDLRKTYDLQGRKATATHPGVDEEGSGPFTAEAGNSAEQGSYQITVEQLASGSRALTQDNAFTSTSDVLTGTADTLTFAVGSDSFDIAVGTTMTLSQLKNAINDASDNFGVKASIIDTGTGIGPKLILTSEVTGDGNDLSITDAGGNLGSITGATIPTGQEAKNAKAVIDGLAVESSTNEFENVIENVSFEVTKLSDVDYLDPSTNAPIYKESTLNVGADKDGLKNRITDFVDNYNGLMDEIKKLTRYGQSELEEDGALAGDFMTRGIQSGLSTIVSKSVENSALGTLFQIGISFDKDGKLEISETDDYGLGSGMDKLDEALDNNYDDIATLFSDPDGGIANQLYDFAYQYTTFGGLLRTREESMKNEKELLFDERARVELQISSYEQVLRDKYINLDLTVAKLNRTGNALAASLGMG
jgi:flagellar hook-associated protein 2